MSEDETKKDETTEDDRGRSGRGACRPRVLSTRRSHLLASRSDAPGEEVPPQSRPAPRGGLRLRRRRCERGACGGAAPAERRLSRIRRTSFLEGEAAA
jgi:hypothetical protein